MVSGGEVDGGPRSAGLTPWLWLSKELVAVDTMETGSTPLPELLRGECEGSETGVEELEVARIGVGRTDT